VIDGRQMFTTHNKQKGNPAAISGTNQVLSRFFQLEA
jgi:hypothetical protein